MSPMQMNPSDFFRQAILKITGSLEIEKALYNSYMYLKDFVPLDDLLLMNPDFEQNRMNVAAQANDQGGALDSRHWDIPPEIMDRLKKNQVPEIMIINDPEAHFLAKHAAVLGVVDSSILVIRLMIKEKLIGSLVLRARGHGRFSPSHGQLLAPLKEPFAIALSNSLRFQELEKIKDLIADDSRYFQEELRKYAGVEIVGADYGLKGVMDLVNQVAPTDAPVLLRGDTGTGKELFAGAIHSLSARSNGPIVKINCGAIPPSLLDSELFGHEKGAFTGALAAKRGRFERAHQGSLFLDEIGELTPEAQVRLLRVLQEKEIERVGGERTTKVDVRIIAATHRSLESMVERGLFRKDLFFRLMVFPVEIPPLRQRQGDIPALAHYFISKRTRERGLKETPLLSSQGLDNLMAYHWPGNVRELENAVERELILSPGKLLNFSQLASRPPTFEKAAYEETHEETWELEAVVRGHIEKALAQSEGRVAGPGGAAQLLKINPSTLRSRMRKLSIPFGRKAGG